MRRWINISVIYMLGKRYISYTITQVRLSAFPCGITQHVRRKRCSIVNMIQSVLEFFRDLCVHSDLCISSPF